jgi:predicted Zn-dependent protease
MAPNGMMLVWSGLLLRVENEAQLAAILGHELGHYLERHTVEQLRNAKDKAVLAQLAGILGGIGGAIGQVGILASLFAFSREHEARADRAGMRMMLDAGYDGREAAKVWENLLGELRVTGGENVGERSQLFATHPPTGSRRDDLRRMAGAGGGVVGAQEFKQVIAPLRFGWLQDEIRRGQYEESLVLFDRMLASDAQDTQVRYARGEVLRLRADGTDLQQAVDELTRATQAENPPGEAWRALGLAQKQRGNGAAAVAAFDRYLAVAPDAGDAAMVRSWIEELGT